MTEEDTRRHRVATTCFKCDCPFTHSNYRVKHHDHVTGEYLFPCCNNCNLQLKAKKSKVTGSHKVTYAFPIVFHNLKGYGSHFVIKYFEKQYPRRQAKGGKVTFDDVKVIPLNGERFLHFFPFSKRVTRPPRSSAHEKRERKFRKHHQIPGDNELLFAKGVYPYRYMTHRWKFQESQLPPIENFYNTLNDEPLSTEDYQRAQDTWKFFNIQNLQQYHDHYLLADVLLLSDVFQNF